MCLTHIFWRNGQPNISIQKNFQPNSKFSSEGQRFIWIWLDQLGRNFNQTAEQTKTNYFQERKYLTLHFVTAQSGLCSSNVQGQCKSRGVKINTFVNKWISYTPSILFIPIFCLNKTLLFLWLFERPPNISVSDLH